MPIEKLDMEEKLRILEDLNMLYIRQIALSLQVKARFRYSLTPSVLHATVGVCEKPGEDCRHVNPVYIFDPKSLGVRAVYCGGCLMWCVFVFFLDCGKAILNDFI